MPEPEYLKSWEDQIRLYSPKTARFFITKNFMPTSTCLEEHNLLLDTERPEGTGRLGVRRHQNQRMARFVPAEDPELIRWGSETVNLQPRY